MPKKRYPFLSASGCFHLLALVQSLRPVLASFTAWTSSPRGNASPLAGAGDWFSERKFTLLLTILGATSSALTLLNAHLVLPALCKPREKLLIAPFTLLLSFPAVSPRARQGRRHPAPSSKIRKGPLGRSAPLAPAGRRTKDRGGLLRSAPPHHSSFPPPLRCGGDGSLTAGPRGASGHGLRRRGRGLARPGTRLQPFNVQYLSVHFVLGDF